MKLNEDKFIELLRKSDHFILSEAISKVKNARVLATYTDVKSVIFQDPMSNKVYYANYELTEDTINFTNVEQFMFENKNYKNELKENIGNLFSKEYETNYKKLVESIDDIVGEKDSVESKIKYRINDLMRKEVVNYIDKPKFKVKNLDALKEGLEKLRKDEFFGKFLVESEKSVKTPVILEGIDWNKETGKIIRKKINYTKKVKVMNESYTKKGFHKTSILAKEYWKDKRFGGHLVSLLEEKTKPEVFCEMYKNITLLSEEDLNEMLSKTLLKVLSTNKIDDKLKKIYEHINTNKGNMLNWKLLQEQPPAPMGEVPAEVPPEALDVGAEVPPEVGAEGPAGMDVAPDEIPPLEGEGAEEDLATEATEEVKIVNALLEVVEDIFWNGNQENNELANIIKDLRDMRASGAFDEDKLVTIFRDLFAITQQIGTSPEEESPMGEELPAEGEEEMSEVPVEPAEVGGGTTAAVGEETPLDTYA